jgi:hypothetical protein
MSNSEIIFFFILYLTPTQMSSTIALASNKKPTINIYVNELVNDSANIIEVIDENFIVVEFYKLQFIYSMSDQKFNATKLVPSISESEYRRWQHGQAANTFKDRFPHFFKQYKQKEFGGRGYTLSQINRIAGSYLDMTLLPIIVSWCNPMRGY